MRSCDRCQRSRPLPVAAPLHPWARLHCDYAGPFLGHRFLVVIDAYSKWLEVCPMTSTTTTATVERLCVLFAQFGLPEMLVTDNGTNFVSAEFASLLDEMVSIMSHLFLHILHPMAWRNER